MKKNQKILYYTFNNNIIYIRNLFLEVEFYVLILFLKIC